MAVTVRITYTAIYEYSDRVLVNDNELKVFPREETWQEPLEYRLESDPPGRVIYYRDRYGNPAARVTIKQVHNRVSFRAVSLVRLRGEYKLIPQEDLRLPLEGVEDDPIAALFLLPSPLIDPSKLEDLARSIVGSTRSLRDVLFKLTDWVYREIVYERGYTSVNTKAHEVVEIGRGVCQDKAHLLIGLLRALGVPARYVSGALTDTPGETHAWVEAYWPGTGWVPIDPTHNRVFNLHYYYVKFAHGRDYKDVPPINGYYISRAKGSIKEVRVVPEILEGVEKVVGEGGRT
ncbi:MAG: transglutaminase family protein [Desulfurococcales archaeon]|nr:transglutaminase family protein [Desulfurococcales archaeon]